MARGFGGYTKKNLECERSTNSFFWVWIKQTKNWQKDGARFSLTFEVKKYQPTTFWKGAECSGYFLNSKYWWRNVHYKMGAFFIRFVTFASTIVVV